MSEITQATSNAIQLARQRGLTEVGADELLLGCLQALSRFGVAKFGPWTMDLEPFGVDWLQTTPSAGAAKIYYSDEAVKLFDLAAKIARADGSAEIRLDHFLVAFANLDTGLMAQLRRDFAIESVTWRTAAAAIQPPLVPSLPGLPENTNEFLTPEQAAESLGIHVQTLRAYIRSGKLPASRIAGERALRIRRHDLNKVLEPLVPEMQ